MNSQHPAVKANLASIKLASEGKKEEWLALYDNNATVKDPVGKSPLDEVGNGHVGIAAIEQFWDTVIGPANIEMTAKKHFISGDLHCAVLQTVSSKISEDKTTSIDMVATYRVNEEGKILEMNAYWNFDELMAQLV